MTVVGGEAEAPDPVLGDVAGFVAVVVEGEFVVGDDASDVTGFDLGPD